MMARGKRKRDDGTSAQIAALFEQARTVATDDQAAAQRLVAQARKLASRRRISLRAYNRVHCRACNAYFTAKTLRVRTRSTHVVYRCLSCGAIRRLRKN